MKDFLEGGMMQTLINVCAIFGVISLGATLVILLAIILDGVKDFYERCVYTHKRKHRFDRPPLAKCYCVDCVYGVKKYEDTVICTQKIINHSADSFFCKDAYPRRNDPDKEIIKEK